MENNLVQHKPNELVKAAIVDYGICNMFSVQHACEKVGMVATLTSSIKEIFSSDLVILPGVGAFGEAMDALRRLDLIQPLRDLAASDKPLIGICLGLQLLMTESCEFGHHEGLNIIPGKVKRFASTKEGGDFLKVPHVGWNKISKSVPPKDLWEKTPLNGISEGEYVYFVHSYYIEPEDQNSVLSLTTYGEYEFCSSISRKNIVAFQFHPERSGKVGLRMYANMLSMAKKHVLHC